MRVPDFRVWITVALFAASAAGAQTEAPKAPAKSPQIHTKDAQAAMTPASSLAKLKAGNERFRTGKSVERNLPAKVRATAEGQYPYAVLLSCMDSRTPAEILFDQTIGALFSIRVAGNVVNADNLGSIEYATKVVGVKLVVVMGHTACGAVKGAIDNVKLGNLTELLNKIQPAVKAAGAGTSKDSAYVDKVGEANVRQAMKEIREKSPTVKEAVDSGAVGLVGAMYDLETGTVKFLAD